jgi:dephospho-CoA kinase
MNAVLVTGMSGVGKSTVLAELGRREIDVVDTDVGDWIDLVDGEPLWNLDLLAGLLDRPRDRPLVVQATVANQGSMYDRFDAIILLTAPEDVIVERLGSRTLNDYGKTPHELAKIKNEIRDIEPLLREGATHIIDTSGQLMDVVAAVEDVARRGTQNRA